jgi:hypothetical protein
MWIYRPVRQIEQARAMESTWYEQEIEAQKFYLEAAPGNDITPENVA